ncbi:Ser/Thr protein phosphatase [Cupriavidus gilardii CR3]|nr:Ser/Thr protein phosphatase [Cupriavidus gilardii CR3]
MQKLLRKARKGTEVIYVPGNHDEVARQFDGLAFGDVVVREEAVHVTATGRRLWVVHGDLFDGVVQHARWLAYLGDTLYTLILALNRHFNRIRARLGFPYWSLSQYLKHQVKNAVNYISSFEHAMVEEARRRGCDGVVCGHIHKAEIREVDGQLYCNDGDWVESLSALVETVEGELKIVYWTTLRDPRRPSRAARARAPRRRNAAPHSDRSLLGNRYRGRCRKDTP